MEPVQKALEKIPEKSYYRIGEVARITGVKAYVLRYWETEFKSIVPPKSRSQQRMYRRRDIENILRIKHLLYKERFTIEGARKRLAELQRADSDKGSRRGGDGDPPTSEGGSSSEALRTLQRVRRELEVLRGRLAEA